MKKITKSILELFLVWILKLFAQFGLYGALVFFFSTKVREVTADGERVPPTESDGNITALFLSPVNFRGDQVSLAGEPGMRVLEMSTHWHSRLVNSFCRLENYADLIEFQGGEQGDGEVECRSRLRGFFRNFLPRLYAHLGIDVVVSANARYREDIDWGRVSDELNYPFVLLFREGLVITEYLQRKVADRHRMLKPFHCSRVIAWNQDNKEMFLKSQFVAPEKITVMGPPRMDAFFRSINEGNHPKPECERVTLFSFRYPMAFEGEINRRLEIGDTSAYCYNAQFRDSHMAILRLAAEMPEVEFVIKPKPKHLRTADWLELLQEMEHSPHPPSSLPNFRIDPDADVHDLIFRSKVVIGLRSTTTLESAIAGKAVIVPLFREYAESEDCRQHLGFYPEDLELFDVAGDVERYVALIKQRLTEEYTPSEEVMEGRRAVLKRWLTDIDGKNSERFASLLKELVTDKGQMRQPARKRI